MAALSATDAPSRHRGTGVSGLLPRGIAVYAIRCLGVLRHSQSTRNRDRSGPQASSVGRGKGLRLVESLPHWSLQTRKKPSRFVGSLKTRDSVRSTSTQRPLQHSACRRGLSTPRRAQRFQTLKYAPAIFQEEINGGPDLRIAVVGDRIFCCESANRRPRIGPSSISRWRTDRECVNLRLPESLKEPLRRLHARMGLSTGVYDFKLDGEAHPYFLEVNPSGQWLDMEAEGHQPLSEAVARTPGRGEGRGRKN